MIPTKYKNKRECLVCGSISQSGNPCKVCGKYIPVEIIDDNGMHWRYNYDKRRIYCIEGEEELKDIFREDPSDENYTALWQNGYYANTPEEGFVLLKEYGYID